MTIEEAAAKVSARDNERPEEAGEVERRVLCLDSATGAVSWSRSAHRGLPTNGRHRKNTYASATPVVDDDRVYALFGNVGVFAYDHDGRLLWRHHLESLPIYNDFGTGSSPALGDRHVYIVSDNDRESFLLALDKETGEEAWRAVRSRGQLRSAWATPLVWKNELRTEIVAPGGGRVFAYSPEGEELWRIEGFSRVATPTPFPAGGRLILSSGSVSEPVRPLLAMHPGARGTIDLSQPLEDQPAAAAIAWYQPKGGTYIPTPVADDDVVYVIYDKGFISAYDLETGERLYRSRIGTSRPAFSSSPWIAGDLLFALSESGETFVFEKGREYRLLHSNDIGEMALATPALTEDALYLRTRDRLLKIAAPDAAARAGSTAR